MQVFHYPMPETNESIIIIGPIQNEEEYLVIWQDLELGYIYPTLQYSSFIKWKGSNPILNLLAPQIGEYIEENYI